MNNNVYELQTDIMRYKPNKLAFLFCVLAIVFNVAMFLIIYQEANCTSDFLLGIDLVINVVFMLAVFLLSEKAKAYKKTAGFVAILMGIIEMARILFIPCYYYGLHLNYLETGEGIVGLSQPQFTWCVVLMVLSGLCLIVAGIDTIKKSARLAEHLSRIEGKE